MATRVKQNKKINKSKKQKEESNFMTFFSAASNSYVLMMRNHFKSSSFYLGNLLIPLLVVVSCGILFPITYSFIWMLFFSSAFSSFAAYGTLFFSIRKSSMMKNIDMTVNESSSLYFSTLAVIFSVSGIAIIVMLVSLIGLSSIIIAGHPFLSNQFGFNNNKPAGVRDVHWEKIWWDMLVYYWASQAILAFAMSFLIEQITTTQKNYFTVVFVYMIGAFFFGGIMSPTVIVENGILSIRTVEKTNGTEGSSEGIITTLQAGGALWWISQLWPHFGINQLAFNTIEAGSKSREIASIDLDPWSDFLDVHIWEATKVNSTLMYFLTPWGYTFASLWIGGLLDRFNKQ